MKTLNAPQRPKRPLADNSPAGALDEKVDQNGQVAAIIAPETFETHSAYPEVSTADAHIDASQPETTHETTPETTEWAEPLPTTEPWVFVVPADKAGLRLDKVLATVWPFSRSSFKRAHQKGRVTLDGQRSANARLVKAGQIVKFWPMEGQDENIDPSVQLADCPIIYQDSSIFIINKPAGVTSHQDLAARGPFLTSFLLTIDPNLADIGDPGRPGLVHRLDKFTSGLMVVARSPEAFESLKTSFQDRLVLKKYLAFVFGAPKITGLLESNLARHPTKRHKFTVVKENGRLARSIIKVLRTFPATNVSLVEVTLLTGRTHQARLHLKQAQAPILGDAVYGVSWAKSLSQFPSLKPFLARQLLHARRLAFPHPEGGYKAFRAPWPEDFRGLWRELNRLEKNNS